MTRSTKVWAVFICFAFLGFLLGSNAPIGSMIWPANPHDPTPTTAQLPFFIFLSLFEAVAFGVAISFLIFGWPTVRKLSGANRTRALGLYLPTVWLLGNWVVHSSLHMHNGMNLQGLLYIEYAFHVTLMAAGMWLAASILSLAREGLLGKGKSAA